MSVNKEEFVKIMNVNIRKKGLNNKPTDEPIKEKIDEYNKVEISKEEVEKNEQ